MRSRRPHTRAACDANVISRHLRDVDHVPQRGLTRRQRDARREDNVAQAVMAANGDSVAPVSSVEPNSFAIDSSDR